jgi:nitrogen fixation NifU-like protein
MSDMGDLYQEVIMDHNRNPRNYRGMDAPTSQADGSNPLCGDQVTVFVHVDDDTITDVSFTGVGCAISKSSASLMTQTLKGKSVAEAQAFYKSFHALITHEGKPDMDLLGKLKVFEGVGEFPARVKCATLAWRTMAAALEGKADQVSTE